MTWKLVQTQKSPSIMDVDVVATNVLGERIFRCVRSRLLIWTLRSHGAELTVGDVMVTLP